MNPELHIALANVAFGPAQVVGSVFVLPVTDHGAGTLSYIGLTGALREQLITITEVNDSGTVPELLAMNHGPQPVLLIAGEEISGAKQNRILNTSILVPPNRTIRIPVSCTEQGRWSYASRHFDDSGVVAALSIRARKTGSVSASLRERRGFSSDQMEVWDGVRELHATLGTHAPTGAMRDAYAARQHELGGMMNAFAPIPGQRGLMVAVAGRVLGLDMTSRPEVYQDLHPKLLMSYLIHIRGAAGAADESRPDVCAEGFMRALVSCDALRFDSPGLGDDYRLSGDAIVGAALWTGGELVHAACFPRQSPEPRGRDGMASYIQRRGWQDR